jgi:hypothetical protein
VKQSESKKRFVAFGSSQGNFHPPHRFANSALQPALEFTGQHASFLIQECQPCAEFAARQ